MMGQCEGVTASDGLIVPCLIPGVDCDAEPLRAAALRLSTVAIRVRYGCDDASVAWTPLSSVLRVSGTEVLWGALGAPLASLRGFADRCDAVADALRELAVTYERVVPLLRDLQGQAVEFLSQFVDGDLVWTVEAKSPHQGRVTRVIGPYTETLVHWRNNEDVVNRNTQLVEGVAHLVADLVDAEQRCANTIRLLRHTPELGWSVSVPRPVEQFATQYPWGQRTERYLSGMEKFTDGVVQSMQDSTNSLGLIAGYNPSTSEFGDFGYSAFVGAEAVKNSSAAALALVPSAYFTVNAISPEAGKVVGDRAVAYAKGVVNYDGWVDSPAHASGALASDAAIGIAAGALTAGIGPALGTVGKAGKTAVTSSAANVAKKVTSTRGFQFFDSAVVTPMVRAMPSSPGAVWPVGGASTPGMLQGQLTRMVDNVLPSPRDVDPNQRPLPQSPTDAVKQKTTDIVSDAVENGITTPSEEPTEGERTRTYPQFDASRN